MDLELARRLEGIWQESFPGSELPVVFFFSDQPRVAIAPEVRGWRCFLSSLAPVRRGTPLSFALESLGCEGAKRYVGFVQEPPSDQDLFLSSGVPGGRQGLRLKQTPHLVHASQARGPRIVAAGRYLVAKRWDQLAEDDEPVVVTCFVRADALAGLVSLASFDRADDDGSVCPSVAGCASVFGRAYAERDEADPRCIVGMFDFTPRLYGAADELTFSAPLGRFRELIDHLPQSFAATAGWQKMIRRRSLPQGG